VGNTGQIVVVPSRLMCLQLVLMHQGAPSKSVLCFVHCCRMGPLGIKYSASPGVVLWGLGMTNISLHGMFCFRVVLGWME